MYEKDVGKAIVHNSSLVFIAKTNGRWRVSLTPYNLQKASPFSSLRIYWCRCLWLLESETFEYPSVLFHSSDVVPQKTLWQQDSWIWSLLEQVKLNYSWKPFFIFTIMLCHLRTLFMYIKCLSHIPSPFLFLRFLHYHYFLFCLPNSCVLC